MTRSRFRRLQIAALAILLAAAAWTYFPSLQNGFTNWDDQEDILENPLVREWSLSTVKGAFTSVKTRLYIPLPLLSFSLQHHIWGFDPFFFHLADLLLHLCNIFLVYRFLFRLTGDFRIAFLAATLFGLHPVQVQSVCWALERRNLMYAFFFLISLTAWMDYSRTRGTFSYLSSFGNMLLSLLSKAVAVTLPVLFFLCEQGRGLPFTARRITARRILEKLPFFLLGGVFVLLTLSAAAIPRDLALSERILMACYSVVFSLGLLLWPEPLSVVYPYPETVNGSYPPFVYVCPFILAALFFTLWRFRNSTRWYTFSGLFFFVNLFPVSRIFPAGAPLIANDHFLYIPSIGVFLLVSEIIKHGYRQASPAGKKALFGCVLGVVVVLSGLTHARTRVWENTATLFENTISHYQGSPIPYNQLGLYYHSIGDWPTARHYYNQLVTLFPLQARHRMIRGKALLRAGMPDAAMQDFAKALEMAPGNPEILFHRGTAFLLQKRLTEALNDFDAVIAQDPSMAAAYANRAWAEFGLGGALEAVQDATRAFEAEDSHAASQISRALFAWFRLDFTSALTDLLDAERRLKSDFPLYVQREIRNFFAFGPWDFRLLTPGNVLHLWRFFPGFRHLIPAQS